MNLKLTSLLCVALFSGLSAAAKLDIGEYLSLADEGIIYPSEAQLELLRPLVPRERFQAAPPISDRAFWNAIAVSQSGREWVKAARANRDKKPEVPISDEIYRRANKEGNRPIYKPRYYRTMERLERFILAECIEDKGRYLPQIEQYLKAIMAMKSWLHPNHDDNDNGVLEGRRVSIDLGARKFGSDLALAKTLLGDRLPVALLKEIDEQLRWRMLDTYLTSCRENDENNHWIKSTSNWNSVCTSGTVYSIIASVDDHEKRVAAIGSALNSMVHYLSGFGEDGYCSEGIGYWGYGFGHYLYLAEILHDYTGGKVDLFVWNNPEKLRAVGNFPENIHIQEGCFPAFSDSKPTAKIDGSGFQFAGAMAAKYYGSKWPYQLEFKDAVEQLIHWKDPLPEYTGEKMVLADVTYFDDMGIVISRGTQKERFSIAIKAGHNDENHNHSDVGSYTIVLGDDFPVADPSSPSYIAGGFDPDNDARSSWGHPVPYVNGKRQSNGREFEGKVLHTEFRAGYDRVVMDIRRAYEVPELRSLERSMENDKAGSGTIRVEDVFSAAEPIAFGTAMMTYSDYEVLDSHTVLFKTDGQVVRAEIRAEGGDVEIVVDEITTRMGSGKVPQRIGINFKEPLAKGLISITYRPVE